MATITKAQLATRVLQRLTILAAGESPSAADSALVEAKIDTAQMASGSRIIASCTTSVKKILPRSMVPTIVTT